MAKKNQNQGTAEPEALEYVFNIPDDGRIYSIIAKGEDVPDDGMVTEEAPDGRRLVARGAK